MAEVEKISTTATSSPEANISSADIPLSELGEAAGNNTVEFGTSPTQEKSSNSHPHDSEYDTASDLEGGVDEYDDEEDDDDLDDESMTDGESMTDDDDDDDDEEDERQGSISLEKAEIEEQKKVDEDRSNPQYIPKRGTFYEHDDRTAEIDVDRSVNVDEICESQDGAVSGVKPPQSPTISQASKTMKKWQPASAVERWSHDRFDASEQAPKSRTELVSAYGYDIRTEDAPPRARRRRRYGRGPSKYSRNWEDESAYLKASNKERKPPRPSDFPVLNERNAHKTRKPQTIREEKENRMDKRSNLDKSCSSSRPSQQQEERRDMKVGKGKNFSNHTGNVGRQAPMEFKQKQRNARHSGPSYRDSQNSRNDSHYDRGNNRHQSNTQQNSGMVDHNQHKSGNGKGQTHSRQSQAENAYGQVMDHQVTISGGNHSSYSQQKPKSPMQSQQQSSNIPIRQQQQPKNTPPASNLSQRLQQVQNRNDPSHVGSVQMHALASQNQIVGQQQQLAGANVVLNNQQSPPAQPLQQIPQEQRGPPKRYSSLRRSQHEAQHITDQMQQMHIQQQQPPMLIQDQHMIQANLMQLYHQENLQAMQAIQATPNPSQPQKTNSGYAPVPPASQGTPYANSGNTGTSQTAFYVASPDVYTASAAAGTQAQPPGQYAQQAPSNYLPSSSTPTTANIAYAGGPSTTTPPQVAGAPATSFGQPTAVPPATVANAAGSAANNSNANFSNYQNYNTVGGTTYFVPPAQATTRPVVLPQRRPTNAIPILPPSEKNKQRSADAKDEAKLLTGNSASQGNGAQSSAPIGSAENIDHIIDNMFVQRPAFQPPQAGQAATTNPNRKSSSPSSTIDNSGGDSSSIGNASLGDDVAAIADKSSKTGENAQSENNMNNSIIITNE
ncbi:protein CASC3 [Ceratitis capitata]|uniref:Protein CASC3 n=1 Tax=Ceratitis capitata TaxID=7213 RepID=W8C338_CERCA|nr:protein CASC3 [Ceratitis capitata]XP_004533626.1 protein CASC3 [Ceratitis capitata]CAD6993915.1 unnamed protein product [Ceratitis capitata]